jgi:hypothetical protein
VRPDEAQLTVEDLERLHAAVVVIPGPDGSRLGPVADLDDLVEEHYPAEGVRPLGTPSTDMLLTDSVELVDSEVLAAVGAQNLEVGRLAVLLVGLPPHFLERVAWLLAARPNVFRHVRRHLLE